MTEGKHKTNVKEPTSVRKEDVLPPPRPTKDPYKALAEAAEFLKQQSSVVRKPIKFMLGGKIYNSENLTLQDAKELHEAGLFNDKIKP